MCSISPLNWSCAPTVTVGQHIGSVQPRVTQHTMVYCQCLIHFIHNLLSIRFGSPSSDLFAVVVSFLRQFHSVLVNFLICLFKPKRKERKKYSQRSFFLRRLFFPLLSRVEKKRLQLRAVTCFTVSVEWSRRGMECANENVSERFLFLVWSILTMAKTIDRVVRHIVSFESIAALFLLLLCQIGTLAHTAQSMSTKKPIN